MCAICESNSQKLKKEQKIYLPFIFVILILYTLHWRETTFSHFLPRLCLRHQFFVFHVYSSMELFFFSVLSIFRAMFCLILHSIKMFTCIAIDFYSFFLLKNFGLICFFMIFLWKKFKTLIDFCWFVIVFVFTSLNLRTIFFCFFFFSILNKCMGECVVCVCVCNLIS